MQLPKKVVWKVFSGKFICTKDIFLGSVKVRICCDDSSGWNFLGLLKIFSIPPHNPEPKVFRSPLPGLVSQNIIRTAGFVHVLFLQKSG